MTIIEALKELFKINLDELNYNLDLKLLIEFKDDKFIIIDRDNIILEGDILNYNLSFGSQKKFILDVGSKIFKFFRDNETMEYKKLKTAIYKRYKIVGYGDFMFKKYTIKLELDKLKNIDPEEYEKFEDKIIYNLDWNKIDVINGTIKNNEYFYVNIVIKEKNILVKYMHKDNLKNVLNTVNRFLDSDIMTIYYSDVDEKEADKAVEFIKDLINKLKKGELK